MEPFKNVYNKKSVKELADAITLKYPAFKNKDFCQSINQSIDELELKDRVKLISSNLHSHLPISYKKSCQIFKQILKNSKGVGLSGFIVWPLTQFVEEHGLDDPRASFRALEEMTKRFTAEFAMRPFINKHPKLSYEQMLQWSTHKNEHLRRLSSEGSRPNLPWGIKINLSETLMKKNLKILETLKDDPAEYVRKSVANHLNDISRVEPDLMIKTVRKWKKNSSPDRDWVIKHALRTLLKNGHPSALEIQGFHSSVKVKLANLEVDKKKIKEGDSLNLSFDVETKEKTETPVMVDYIIHYPKKNGKLSPKVFKLKTLTLKPKLSQRVNKKVSFKKVTTRVHYKGVHLIEIQVNGKKMDKIEFILI